MLNQLGELKGNALAELEVISDAKKLELWRIHWLGKKSELSKLLRGLATLSVAERKAVGAEANRLKVALTDSLKQKELTLREKQLTVSAEEQDFDITLPGRIFPVGHLHPLTQTLHEACDIFVSLGFQVIEGPEVEWDYYNFEALNILEEHPARDSMSTSWVDYQTEPGKRPMLLRTHTTSLSARVVESRKPPVRVVEIGMITPPIGINVFIIKGVAGDVPMYTIFRGIMPFLLSDLGHLALLLILPQITLFLPRLLGMM